MNTETPFANWSFPTAIRFGVGRIAELPEACRAAGMAKPLLVTDPGLAALPMVTDAVATCRAAGLDCAVFSAIRPNPTWPNVEDGVTVLRDGGHDGVIAFGGGSALDAGKSIAFMVGQTRPIWDFEDIGDHWTRADADGILPIVAVPTTAGTGSEVGRAAVVTDEVQHVKKIIFHPKMLPAIVIADPALTVGLPAPLTAATGMDALAHALEAYCAPGFHPMADGIAVEAMRLVREWLPVAVREGGNLEARGNMLAAAAMGAVAFQQGLGAIHSVSHPLGALYDKHHGLLNAVVMPYVLAFNRSAIEDRLDRLARWLDLPGEGFAGVMAWILELREAIGIPNTLAELGIDDRDADRIGVMAAEDPTAGGNPVPVDAADLKGIFLDALSGRL
jgi:alcohol dehydrogenase class IV